LSLRSITSERYGRWQEALYRFGYLTEEHPTVTTSRHAGTVGIRARRRPDLGAPEVVVDVAEKWTEGADPDGLGLEEHGCHLEASSWHAQLRPGEQGTERIDVDRRKPTELMRRHPFGSPNDERKPERNLYAPEAWLTHVEELSANLYFKQTKPTK
jgi:hypothetical protein